MNRHYSKKRAATLSLPPFVRMICLIVAGVLTIVWLVTFFSNQEASGKKKFTNLSKRLGGNKHRIAIIIPFVGEGPESIPPYLELFCISAAGSASLVDFLLIHNGVLDGYHGDKCPSNVVFISLQTMHEFSTTLVRVADQLDEATLKMGSKDKLARALTKLIDSYPYIMVEFKPALGHIFAEYLKGYSHWGYSDLDILFGDLPRFITKDELTEFDIVTYSFGDQNRLYLRGQFTFHKNTDKINQLWRSCGYLAHMDQRFANIMSGNGQLHFESAEGCYSAAVLQQPDISVKYAVKAFTDVQESDTMYSHGLYVSTGGPKNSYTMLYKAGTANADGKSLATIADKWFEMKSDYNDRKKPMVQEIGDRESVPLVENPDAHCMYWAQKKYQSRLCVDGVDSTDTVFWINGVLYKQKYKKMPLPGNIITAPFFHFQEWKRYYRSTQLTGFHRGGLLRTFVLTKEGVLPIFPHEFSGKDPRLPSPLGISPFKWNGVKNNNRNQLPGHTYCLQSGPRKKPPTPPAPQCRFVTSWRDKESIEILSGAPRWRQIDINTEVTMVLTLQIRAEQAADPSNLSNILNLLAMYLNRWQGQPSVLFIHVAGATPEAIAKLRLKLGPDSDLSYFGLDTCLVGAIFSRESIAVSRKTLLNMAIDAAPTRWVLSGFEIERGIAISQDTAFFAHRVAETHVNIPGSVFIIPQFGVVNEENDFTIPALFKTTKNGNLVESLSQIDKETCEDGEDNPIIEKKDHVFKDVHALWFQLTQRFVTGSRSSSDEKSIEQEAMTLDKIQLQLISLLAEKNQYDLFAFDISPILLTDNLGPHTGIMTSDFVREPEEFGGKLCYNGLHLAQLATYGYNINVLAGAFGLSTPTTRSYANAGDTKTRSVLGYARCDGCFFFDEEHENILESIAKDERARPAKAALLWMHEEDEAPLHGHT